MTATLAPPDRGAAATVGFGNVLRSEWTKLRSVRSTCWTLAGAALLMLGLGVVVCVRFAQVIPHADPGALVPFDATLTSLEGLYLAQIAVGAVGVLVITSEYGTGAIRATFSAVPQRPVVLAAKVVVFGATALVVGEVAAFATFGVGQAILSGTDPGQSGVTPSVSLADPGVLRAVIGAGLYVAAVGLLGLGIGAVIRNTAGALSAFFGLLFGLTAIVDLLPSSWHAIIPYLPANSGSQIFTVYPDHDALGPWTGFGVFCCYAVVALAVGTVLVSRRDA